MDNKTYVSAIGMALSIGGWFLWTLLMATIYKPKNDKAYLQYPLYHDFYQHYGSDLSWWLNVILIVTALILFEIAVSSLRKTFWPTDTDVFQELEQDPIIRKRFEETVRNELEGNDDEVEMGREEGKGSYDLQRESDIQALLDRPRVMDNSPPHGPRSPIILNRSETGSLRRRVSTDVHAMMDIERSPRSTAPPPPMYRHSVDIAELLEGRV
jgi:phospholipid-translocating ATPase